MSYKPSFFSGVESKETPCVTTPTGVHQGVPGCTGVPRYSSLGTPVAHWGAGMLPQWPTGVNQRPIPRPYTSL